MNKTNANDTVLVDSGLKAYILQQIYEFEGMFSENAVITVEEKNVDKMIKRLIKDGSVADNFQAKHCYQFSIKENDHTISSYGLANDPYEALKIASDKLMTQLHKMQDETLSTADHLNEVNSYLNGNNTKH